MHSSTGAKATLPLAEQKEQLPSRRRKCSTSEHGHDARGAGAEDQSERSSAVLRLGNLKHQENANTDKLIARKAPPLGGPAVL